MQYTGQCRSTYNKVLILLKSLLLSPPSWCYFKLPVSASIGYAQDISILAAAANFGKLNELLAGDPEVWKG